MAIHFQWWRKLTNQESKALIVFGLIYWTVLANEVAHSTLGPLEQLGLGWVAYTAEFLPLILAPISYLILAPLYSGPHVAATKVGKTLSKRKRFLLVLSVFFGFATGLFLIQETVFERVYFGGWPRSTAHCREMESKVGFKLAFRNRSAFFLAGQGRREKVEALCAEERRKRQNGKAGK